MLEESIKKQAEQEERLKKWEQQQEKKREHKRRWALLLEHQAEPDHPHGECPVCLDIYHGRSTTD